jgi:hypothetical protein
MKFHTLYFLVLKLSFLIQFALVIAGLESENSIAYVLSDFLFKMSVGLFLILFFFFNHFPELHGYDKIVISFGGGLLVYDAIYHVLPKLFIKGGIAFNPFSFTKMFTRV